jgi:hypothetical protein
MTEGSPVPPPSPHEPAPWHVVKQEIDELRVLSANDEIEARIVNLIASIRTQLQLQCDNHGRRLTDLEARMETVVGKEYVQKFFSKMRAAMADLTENMAVMKDSIPERVTKTELQNVAEDLFRTLKSETEPVIGVTPVKCLLCGRPKTAITGMIRDSRLVEALGEPPEASTAGVSNSQRGDGRGTMLYGPDRQLYRGRGNLGRPAMAQKPPLPPLDKKP